MMNYINAMIIMAQLKIRRFFSKEDGAVDIVAIVILVGVAVALAIIFRNALGKLVKDLMSGITDDASKVAGTIEGIDTFGE